MGKMLFKIMGFLSGAIAGMVASTIVKKLWQVTPGEDEAPDATDTRRSWSEILTAAALQGAIFAVIRAAVDRGPDHREDRALQRGGGKDLAPASPGIAGVWRLVLARRELPQLLDDRAGQHPSQQAGKQTQALKQQVPHLLRLPGYGRV